MMQMSVFTVQQVLSDIIQLVYITPADRFFFFIVLFSIYIRVPASTTTHSCADPNISWSCTHLLQKQLPRTAGRHMANTMVWAAPRRHPEQPPWRRSHCTEAMDRDMRGVQPVPTWVTVYQLLFAFVSCLGTKYYTPFLSPLEKKKAHV